MGMEREKEYPGVDNHSLIEEEWVVWSWLVSAKYFSWCILRRQSLLASSCYLIGLSVTDLNVRIYSSIELTLWMLFITFLLSASTGHASCFGAIAENSLPSLAI